MNKFHSDLGDIILLEITKTDLTDLDQIKDIIQPVFVRKYSAGRWLEVEPGFEFTFNLIIKSEHLDESENGGYERSGKGNDWILRGGYLGQERRRDQPIWFQRWGFRITVISAVTAILALLFSIFVWFDSSKEVDNDRITVKTVQEQKVESIENETALRVGHLFFFALRSSSNSALA